MESFYIIVVVVAIVSLILCLVLVGITLQSQQGNKPVFPKLQNVCPDGWKVTPDSCSPNPLNAGDAGHVVTDVSMGEFYSNVWETSFKRKEGASICDKRKWAINNGIQWDGVSNYNQCA
jgi:hypothetical protein